MLDDPGLDAPGTPGAVPQGEPFALLAGVVFGFTVDGCVVFPGVGGFVEFDPGTVPGVPGLGLGVVGVAVLPGGVAGLPGGVAVLGV